MCFGGGGKAAKKEAKRQREEEDARRGRIASGMNSINSTFSKFNEGYYDDRKQDYIDFAMPQFERQFNDARDGMIYALSRTGNLQSGAADRKNADLLYEAEVARAGIADEGLNRANALRNQVEDARSSVVADLNATGDNSAAANAAVRQAVNLGTPVGYSPLSNLFAGFAQSVAAMGSNAGNKYSGFFGAMPQGGGIGQGSSTLVRG